jgi:predicted acyl esterase
VNAAESKIIRKITGRKSMMRPLALALFLLFSELASPAQQTPPASASAPVFTLQEVMIPVRDGAHLQTVILRPVGAAERLPILFTRTPYGVPEKAPEQIPASLKELAQDGYIFVIQNLRGRFKSEGVFLLSSWVDLNDPKATNETTDAYDSIEWLVKNVANNNGNVGMYGVS